MSVHGFKQNTEKTELLWSGLKYTLRKLDGSGPAIKLGSNSMEPSGHVRVLGVILSSDLSFEKHVSAISAACFFHLRSIRRVRQLLDVGSAKTLVQTFVTSRVDCCNAVLAESPRVITDKLQRVMNSAAWVVTNTGKYDSGSSQILNDELHWLDVADRVWFKLAVLMYRCLHGTAPLYLMDSCMLTADVAGRQHLRSATQRKLVMPHYRLIVSVVDALLLRARRLGIRCSAVFVTQNWVSTLSNVSWRRTFSWIIYDKIYSAHKRFFLSMRCITLHFTYLLTYLLTYQCVYSHKQPVCGLTVRLRSTFFRSMFWCFCLGSGKGVCQSNKLLIRSP